VTVTVAGWDSLTAREAEVLAGVERRLSNIEIAAELVVSVRTVETHIAALRRKLGADSRTKLIEASMSRRATAVQLPRNSFVGREGDLATVRGLLEQDRWVTFVGPAGSGKTRLALELAAVDSRTPVVVELEHAAPERVVNAVAKGIGLGVDSSGDLVSACGVALRAQRYLLVLDNADRVLDEVRGLVGRLLTLAAPLTVLVTSRSPLGGSDEVVYPVAPLPVDGTHDSAAVRLFVDRAVSAAPSRAVDATDVDLVARVCRRLDGLPLAIELAAARTRHLPLPELAGRLDAGFDALDRAAPESRHRTLATAFDWTWDLLDDDERTVLSRLAALPRTFDLDLAEAVTAPGTGRVVLRLLDRSLVSPTARATDPQRFRLLRSLRAFVLERTGPDVVDEVRRLHAAYLADLTDRVHDRARTDDSRAAAAEAARLCPEANAAVAWAIEHDPPVALRVARDLSVGGEQYSPDLESLSSICRVARDPRARELATTTDLLEIGMAVLLVDLDLGAELAELALDKVTDDPSAMSAHHLAGFTAAYRHDSRTAMTHLATAERLAEELGDAWQLASVRQARGIALRSSGDIEGAMAAFESAMHSFALAGDAMHVNNARYMMAATAVDGRRSLDEAPAWVEQCAAYARSTGNRHEVAHADLTRAQLTTGPVAPADLADAVRNFQKVGDLRCLARCYLLLGARGPAAERTTMYEKALDVAQSAHDQLHEEQSLEGLIRTRWETGDRRGAAVALGRLVSILGEGPATSRCPEDMRAELGDWTAAIAEGQARQPPRD
jgi:predicted ATPase/DNA-binding CsgD family transcriptional regulator/tetratricopeptide (TPR) repeat protein